MRKVKRQNCTIDILIIIFYAAYYLLPSISNRVHFLIPLAAAAVYVFYVAFSEGKGFSYILLTYLSLIVLLAVLYALLTDASSIQATGTALMIRRFFSKAYQISLMFLPLLFFKRISQNASEKQIIFLLIISYAVFLYVIVTTFRTLAVNPNATRSWSGEGTIYHNTANYYFIYAVPFVTIMLTVFVCIVKHFLIRLLCILGIIFMMVFLFVAQYTLAILIAFLCMALVFLIYLRGFARFLSVLLIVLFLVFSKYILKFLIGLVPSEQVSLRLKEVYSFIFKYDASGYNLSGRMELYWKSIRAFLKSPIYGNRKLDFDGHATFLTVLSDLGLLGGVPYYYLYFNANKITKGLMKNGKLFSPFFVALLMMGFTNPIHAALPLMFTVWFLVPLSLELYSKRTAGSGLLL